MSAHCTSSKLEFARFFNRQVTARFDGGRMSSDGGAIVLREVEQTLNLFERLTQCFTDYRNPGRCWRSVFTELRWAMRTSTIMTGCALTGCWRCYATNRMCWAISECAGAMSVSSWPGQVP